MALLKQGSSNDLQSEADRVSEKLRREAARLAVEKALAALPSKLDAGAQLALIDRSIESLGEV
jgi:F-type H+-transporting ATPase subunit b